MTTDSPFDIIASHTLRAVSFPVRGFLQAITNRQYNRRKVLHVALTHQNIGQWKPGSVHWESLRSLKELETMNTIWLTIKVAPLGWARISAFRALLHELKSAGKSIMVLIESSDARVFTMSACADKIWIQSGVELFWSGIGGRQNFYGAAFEKYGIKADVEAAGVFKSFGEQYVRTEPTQANRTQLMSLFDSLFQETLENLCVDTKVDKSSLCSLLQESPITVNSLIEKGLVEGEGDVFTLLERVMKYADTDGKPLEFSRFVKRRAWIERFTWGRLRQTIAVVHLDGSITDFEQDQDGVVADRTVQQLRSLRDMRWIEAVILKINSPGGSAVASERIATAIEHLRTEKKVIAYMENVAASGGYYISAVTDWIWASPQTITGSIGVVGGKMVLGKALEAHGVHAHDISVGGDATFFDYWTPFSDLQRSRFKGFLNRTYNRFCRVVSKGRRLSKEAVEEVAQGRVWTGKQAVEAGLVDELGSLDDCIADLIRRMGRTPKSVEIVHIHTRPRGWRKWRTRLFGAVNPSVEHRLMGFLPRWLQVLYRYPNQPLTVLPFDVEGQ